MRGIRRTWLLPALIIFPALAGRLAPGVFTDFRGLVLGLGLTYGIVALSLNLLSGYAGQVSLGHAGFMGLGAFTASVTTHQLRLPMLLGLVASVLVGGLIGCAVGLPSLRISGVSLAIGTLAFGAAMQQSVFLLPLVTAGAAGAPAPRPRFGSFEMTANFDYLSLLVAASIAVWVADRNLTRSRFGRGFFAQRSSERFALSVGIPVARYRLLAFGLSGAIAALGGDLFAHLVGFVQSESFSFDLSFGLLVIVMLGGIGSRLGVFVSAAIFAIVPRLIEPLEERALLVGGAALMVAVVLHPEGLGSIPGVVRDRAERKRSGPDAIVEDRAHAQLPLPPRAPDPRDPTVPLLGIRDLSVSFGAFEALHDVSLQVAQGTIVGIVGPNGAGKSTLFDCISGFVHPRSGYIAMDGRDLASIQPVERRALGVARTFQAGGLVLDASVLDNVLIARHQVLDYKLPSALLMTHSARSAERAERAAALELLEALDLVDMRERPVAALSGGQRRMIEIACCLQSGPRLALMDEPTAGLSEVLVESLVVRLREIVHRCGISLLLVEHNLHVIAELCDQVYGLAGGRVVASGSPEAVLRDVGIRDAFLGHAT